MTDKKHFHIPRASELVKLSRGAVGADVKPAIELALSQDSVIDGIEDYKTNGGVCGNSRIDDVRAMDIIVDWDKRHGGDSITKSGLTEAAVMQAVNVVLRRKYLLDKKGKIIGVNVKQYRLTKAPTPADLA